MRASMSLSSASVNLVGSETYGSLILNPFPNCGTLYFERNCSYYLESSGLTFHKKCIQRVRRWGDVGTTFIDAADRPRPLALRFNDLCQSSLARMVNFHVCTGESDISCFLAPMDILVLQANETTHHHFLGS